MTSSSAPDPAAPEPGNLRFLRRLVTLLMAVMIAGFLLIVAMFVIRLSGGDLSGNDLALPDRIALPDATRAEAFTMTRDWYAVVTTDGRILIYDRASGSLRQSITVMPAQ